MKRYKKIFSTLLIMLIVIHFIRPSHNNGKNLWKAGKAMKTERIQKQRTAYQ